MHDWHCSIDYFDSLILVKQRFSIALSVSYGIIPDDSANRKYRWKVFFYWVF